LLSIDLNKTFKTKQRNTVVSCRADFELGKTSAIYGRSGVGKSTILRIIAGLDEADNGKIRYKDEVWYDQTKKINLSLAARKVGFVFQDYNLFPNMTVEGNLKYASITNKISDQTRQLLEVTDLIKLFQAYPRELSGGERQRVSIVRALCQKPRILLLDEPFSALDDASIGDLIRELRVVQEEAGATILMVSHRKDVIFEMADSVVHLKDDGMIAQGKPMDLLTKTF
jgi:molybdate transport system ATP-binding protein